MKTHLLDEYIVIWGGKQKSFNIVDVISWKIESPFLA